MFGLNRLIYHGQPFLHSQGILVSYHSRLFNSSSNYYEILGVRNNATEKEIKSAFLTQSKKWHPDVNKSPGATAKFVAVREAYSILGSTKSRSDYDASLREGVRYNPGRSSQSYHGSYTQQQQQQRAQYQTQYQTQNSWQGKGYWQWTPEEEAQFRKWFYENEGRGSYGGHSYEERHRYRSQSHTTTMDRLKIVLGLIAASFVFNIIRIIYFKSYYQKHSEYNIREISESDRKYNDFRKRFNEALKESLEKDELEEIKEDIKRRTKQKEEKNALSGIIPTAKEEKRKRRKREFEDEWFKELKEEERKPSFMGIPTSKEITPLKKEFQGVKELNPVIGEHVADSAQVLDTKYGHRNYLPNRS